MLSFKILATDNLCISKQPHKKSLKIRAGILLFSQAFNKEELINELIIAKANELRAKKGYEVKGAGANKEYIILNNKNTKS